MPFFARRGFFYLSIFAVLLLHGLVLGQNLPQLEPEEFFRRGQNLELQRQWQQAADLYERGARLFPERYDLKDRWFEAERHYSLSRRYHDTSFVNELARMRGDQVLDLYEEVLRKILSSYVEGADVDTLVRRGYRNLLMALDESVFVEANCPGRSSALVEGLRASLRQRPERRVLAINDARQEVLEAYRRFQIYCDSRSLAPIALEFLTAACEGLDPYSAHLTPNRLRDLYAMIDGSFVGLGVEVRGEKQGLVVLNVLPGSPALEAGVKEGDLIIAIDGQTLAGMVGEEAANRLQGKAGTRVALSIRRGEANPKVIFVDRRELTVHSVNLVRMLDTTRGIGYIRLASFQKNSAREVEDALHLLNSQQMKSLVLDLRGNPGGLLEVSVQVANLFIDNGLIVYTRGRAWGQNATHHARASAICHVPMVVLVDGDSASASEILAGAIQEHQRGTIVGSRTYGKGSVQSIFPLRGAPTGLRLTTARFYSPKGRAYEGQGVEPDVKEIRLPLGPLGEENTLPKQPSLEHDTQLTAAYLTLLRPRKVIVGQVEKVIPADK